MSKHIAQTILTQMGGGRQLAVMTGARNFVSTGEEEGIQGGLIFKIGRNAGKVTHVRIRLTWDDLYNVEFLKCRGMKVTTIREFEGIYFDSLQPLFRQVTGMETRMPRIIFSERGEG